MRPLAGDENLQLFTPRAADSCILYWAHRGVRLKLRFFALEHGLISVYRPYKRSILFDGTTKPVAPAQPNARQRHTYVVAKAILAHVGLSLHKVLHSQQG